jgi:hypothetical protein
VIRQFIQATASTPYWIPRQPTVSTEMSASSTATTTDTDGKKPAVKPTKKRSAPSSKSSKAPSGSENLYCSPEDEAMHAKYLASTKAPDPTTYDSIEKLDTLIQAYDRSRLIGAPIPVTWNQTPLRAASEAAAAVAARKKIVDEQIFHGQEKTKEESLADYLTKKYNGVRVFRDVSVYVDADGRERWVISMRHLPLEVTEDVRAKLNANSALQLYVEPLPKFWLCQLGEIKTRISGASNDTVFAKFRGIVPHWALYSRLRAAYGKKKTAASNKAAAATSGDASAATDETAATTAAASSSRGSGVKKEALSNENVADAAKRAAQLTTTEQSLELYNEANVQEFFKSLASMKETGEQFLEAQKNELENLKKTTLTADSSEKTFLDEFVNILYTWEGGLERRKKLSNLPSTLTTDKLFMENDACKFLASFFDTKNSEWSKLRDPEKIKQWIIQQLKTPPGRAVIVAAFSAAEAGRNLWMRTYRARIEDAVQSETREVASVSKMEQQLASIANAAKTSEQIYARKIQEKEKEHDAAKERIKSLEQKLRDTEDALEAVKKRIVPNGTAVAAAASSSSSSSSSTTDKDKGKSTAKEKRRRGDDEEEEEDDDDDSDTRQDAKKKKSKKSKKKTAKMEPKKKKKKHQLEKDKDKKKKKKEEEPVSDSESDEDSASEAEEEEAPPEEDSGSDEEEEVAKESPAKKTKTTATPPPPPPPAVELRDEDLM